MEIQEIDVLLEHVRERDTSGTPSTTFRRLASDAARHESILRRSQLNAAVHGHTHG